MLIHTMLIVQRTEATENSDPLVKANEPFLALYQVPTVNKNFDFRFDSAMFSEIAKFK